MSLGDFSKQELEEVLTKAKEEYEGYKTKGLKLDMSRGKPCPEQLDLSNEMFSVLGKENDYITENNIDTRNYGELSGIVEMKRIFSELLDVPNEKIFVGGNSTLNLMFQTISMAYTKGVVGSKASWGKLDKVKFICLVPGYDRHFAVTDYFGMELVAVPLTNDGPDMDILEELVGNDDTIKGMWCVPLYSNPDGCIYSDEVIKRLATMKTAANDFTIMFDNAYIVHNLYGNDVKVANILDECEKAGNPNRAFVFSSTSKVTFPGAGVCCMACNKESMDFFMKTAFISTIGYDKINMIRHALYLKNRENILSLMKKHADIIRPKFDIVDTILSKNLSKYGIAQWNKPQGGYFMSFNVYKGTAKKVYNMCKEAGVILTSPGATFPYGKDPEDKNIRIAPTYPSVAELTNACEILSLATLIAAIEEFVGIN